MTRIEDEAAESTLASGGDLRLEKMAAKIERTIDMIGFLSRRRSGEDNE